MMRWYVWRRIFPCAIRWWTGRATSVRDGDSARDRYTECRLERIASELLEEIDGETVNFIPNYDEWR